MGLYEYKEYTLKLINLSVVASFEYFFFLKVMTIL